MEIRRVLGSAFAVSLAVGVGAAIFVSTLDKRERAANNASQAIVKVEVMIGSPILSHRVTGR